jgi:hypothetical protein
MSSPTLVRLSAPAASTSHQNAGAARMVINAVMPMFTCQTSRERKPARAIATQVSTTMVGTEWAHAGRRLTPSRLPSARSFSWNGRQMPGTSALHASASAATGAPSAPVSRAHTSMSTCCS